MTRDINWTAATRGIGRAGGTEDKGKGVKGIFKSDFLCIEGRNICKGC